MSRGSFATVINCMDGRTQLPANEHIRRTRGVDYVDTITEPGPDGILAEARDREIIQSIRRRLDISVRKHGSTYAAIVAHHDCAGNPVDKEKHLAHLRKAVVLVRSWGYGCEVQGLWVDEAGRVEVVC